MARIRNNFLSGTLSTGITDVDASVSSTQFAYVPAISGDDYFPIVLNPSGVGYDPEIAYITAHTASATTATISRGKEGTTSIAHLSGVSWVHAPTAIDFNAVNAIDLPKKTVNAKDDEFDTGTLDGKWTVTSGSLGTVSLLASSSAGIYDLTSKPGALLFQVNHNRVALRQNAALENGESLVGCFSFTALADSPTAWGSSEQSIRMGLTSGPSSIVDGTGIRMELAIPPDKLSLRLMNANGTRNELPEEPGVALMGRRFYLRIHRVSNTYYGFYSSNGDSWVSLGFQNIAGTMAYIWIDIYSHLSAGAQVPIQTCEWIRIGSSAIAPW
jgi:hypothetical protein